MTTAERAAASDVSYPLCSFLPFQTANCIHGLAGISISPQTPLNRPEKPRRFFWTFPAIAENPMRIRTTLWTFSAGYFAANIQTQLLTNPLSRIRRRVAETRKVTTEWNAKLKYWCLPEFRGSTHQTRPSTLFSPIFSLAREKMGPPEARQKRPRRNEPPQATSLILCARFFLSKPQTEFTVWRGFRFSSGPP